jgi:hypothetical protein
VVADKPEPRHCLHREEVHAYEYAHAAKNCNGSGKSDLLASALVLLTGAFYTFPRPPQALRFASQPSRIPSLLAGGILALDEVSNSLRRRLPACC